MADKLIAPLLQQSSWNDLGVFLFPILVKQDMIFQQFPSLHKADGTEK